MIEELRIIWIESTRNWSTILGSFVDPTVIAKIANSGSDFQYKMHECIDI